MSNETASTPVHREKLNKKQASILLSLVKLRFTTIPLLAEYLGVKKEPFNRTMRILVDLGYVTKIYDKDFRITRRPALYHLSRAGMQYVRKNTNTSPARLRALYNNSTASPEFIQHLLNVHRVVNWAQQTHGANATCYTKTDLRDREEFATTQPDLLIKHRIKDSSDMGYILLEVLDNPMMFAGKKRLKHLVTFIEDELNELPITSVQLVMTSSLAETRFRRHATRILEEEYFSDDIPVRTTALEKMTPPSGGKPAANIWTPIVLFDD